MLGDKEKKPHNINFLISVDIFKYKSNHYFCKALLFLFNISEMFRYHRINIGFTYNFFSAISYT